MKYRKNENTLTENSKNKGKFVQDDFERFVSNCCYELRQTGFSICFTEEQVEKIKEKYDVVVEKNENYFCIRVKKK